MVAAEQAREDIARARCEWREGMTALDPEKLVFIDESGFDTKMTRRFGRAARGRPSVGALPHGHWRNTTFIAGLRSDRIDAPMLIEGAMDGDAFCAWVEQMLAPTLSAGDMFGPLTRTSGVRGLTLRQPQRPQERQGPRRNRGARRRAALLAGLSPDLNPIEMVFAKLKALVRNAAARCANTLCTAIASALAAFTPQDCARYLRHAGYAST